jgi:hypothetical protein
LFIPGGGLSPSQPVWDPANSVCDQSKLYQSALIQAGHTFNPFILLQWNSNGENGERDEKDGSDEHHHVHSDSRVTGLRWRVVEMCRAMLKKTALGRKKAGKMPLFIHFRVLSFSENDVIKLIFATRKIWVPPCGELFQFHCGRGLTPPLLFVLLLGPMPEIVLLES